MSIRRTISLTAIALAATAAQAFAGADPFVPLPWANAHGASSLARYGAVVSPAGDVNGDGFSDVLTWTAGAAITGITPNPFGTRHGADGARITYGLPGATRVVLDLYDVRGARVRRLVDEVRPAGLSNAAWDGRDDLGRAAPAGIYFARFRADGATDQARLVRLP